MLLLSNKLILSRCPFLPSPKYDQDHDFAKNGINLEKYYQPPLGNLSVEQSPVTGIVPEEKVNKTVEDVDFENTAEDDDNDCDYGEDSNVPVLGECLLVFSDEGRT